MFCKKRHKLLGNLDYLLICIERNDFLPPDGLLLTEHRECRTLIVKGLQRALMCILLFRRICCGGSPPVKPNYTVICIGLSRSGKSSLLAKLSGESTDNIEPTIGFSIKALIFDNCFLDVKELGGGDNVRPYWDRYYLGTQGIIFVVNSAGSEEEMNATKEEFRKAVENEQLEGFPLLVLCNHQDQEGARSTDEISKLLSLDKQTGERPWAIHGTSVQDKSSIKVGFEKLNKFLLEPYNPARNSKDGFDRL